MRERKGSLSVQNSIQTRLSFVMALVMVFVVCINFFIFEQIHTGVDRIDAVFSSNAAINDLSDTLNKLEGTVYEYLNIKEPRLWKITIAMSRITGSFWIS